jgi:hypothetical protein
MDNIDDYIELLYEELPDKIKGTFLILKLTQVPEYLPAILANGITFFPVMLAWNNTINNF